MRSSIWRARVAALGAVTVMLTGCAQVTSDEPLAAETPTTAESAPTRASEPFDPCDIPKEAVTDSGLVEESSRPGFGGITSFPGWMGCAWDGPSDDPWYFLAIQSSINSIDEYLQSPQNERQFPLTIGSRSAVRYHASYDTDPPEGCEIVFDANGNLIIFLLSTIGTEDTKSDPCVAVTKHAQDLESYLPG